MEYEAIIVGSGPNGLAAAITMQRQGIATLLVEKNETIGGGLRSGEITLPGFVHDICSAVHPMAVSSPFMASLPLAEFGLQYIYPPVCAVHPLDGGEAAILYPSLTDTVNGLGIDGFAYQQLISPIVESWSSLVDDILSPPIHIPGKPFLYARFGLNAIKSAQRLSLRFQTEKAKALLAGMAAHAMIPLTHASSAAIALVLSAVGHVHGWPIAKGGSQSIADAMGRYFVSLGGTIRTNFFVETLRQLPSAKVVLLDTSPKQLLSIAGDRLSAFYKWQLDRYKVGMGVYKVDFALDGPIPFRSQECRNAGTVHLGGTFAAIAASEQLTWNNMHSADPFVLVAQQSLFDPTRAPNGKHTAWAYCHVPNGSNKDMTTAIENQIERFAPGFRDLILGKVISTPATLETYNPNYVGGDINGGAIDLMQLFARPVLRISPYTTSAKGLYICSASTPPGGGVHGMCGYHAARTALKDIFKK